MAATLARRDATGKAARKRRDIRRDRTSPAGETPHIAGDAPPGMKIIPIGLHLEFHFYFHSRHATGRLIRWSMAR
jgi:hypothetical protein